MSEIEREAMETVKRALDGLMESYEQDPEQVDALVAAEQERRGWGEQWPKGDSELEQVMLGLERLQTESGRALFHRLAVEHVTGLPFAKVREILVDSFGDDRVVDDEYMRL